MVVTECTLLCLSRTALQKVVGPVADLKVAFRIQALRAVPMMAEMEGALLAQIAQELEPQTFEANKAIIKQGEEGRTFYIVGSGVAIITDANGTEVGRRRQGEFFGEVALIRREVRQANVVAAGIGCRVLAMDRDVRSSTLTTPCSGSSCAIATALPGGPCDGVSDPLCASTISCVHRPSSGCSPPATARTRSCAT